MTRYDIIRMAREAGFEVGRDAGGEYVAPHYSDSVGTLGRFAALVAAYEREECAKSCEARAELGDMGCDFYDACFVAADTVRARSKKEGE